MLYGQRIKETVTRAAPTGGVVKDTAYIIGSEALVAQDAAAQTVDCVFVKRGGCALAVLVGDIPADGAAVYLNNTTHVVQATPGAALYLIGSRNAEFDGDDGATLIGVDFDGVTSKLTPFKATTASLTAVAGATQDVDVTLTGATAATIPQVSVNAYAGTGFPIIAKAVGATDKITVTIANIHASAALNAVAVLNVSID